MDIRSDRVFVIICKYIDEMNDDVILFYTHFFEQMIELPYKEAGFRMVVVLPNEVDGLPTVLEKAATKGLLSSVNQLQPAGRDVDLDMPKFDIRTKVNLNDVLRKVYMEN